MVDVPSANLVLSTFAPTKTFSGTFSIEVPSANLTFSTFGSDEVNIIIPSANLTLSTFALTVGGLTIPGQPLSANLTFSMFAPVVVTATSVSVQPLSANLLLSTSSLVVRRVIPWTASVSNPDLLCPRRVNVRLSNETASPPGRSLTGKKQFIQADAGFWIITLEHIRIRSNADILHWRSLEGQLNGRANSALIQIYDRYRAPIPLSGDPIVAVADAVAAVGTTTVFINVTTGSDLFAGMHFSVGQRLYRIKEIVDQTSGGLYEVLVRPPVREVIADNAALEFDRPVVRCRLASDSGMNITHELLKFSSPNVTFIEDWVR